MPSTGLCTRGTAVANIDSVWLHRADSFVFPIYLSVSVFELCLISLSLSLSLCLYLYLSIHPSIHPSVCKGVAEGERETGKEERTREEERGEMRGGIGGIGWWGGNRGEERNGKGPSIANPSFYRKAWALKRGSELCYEMMLVRTMKWISKSWTWWLRGFPCSSSWWSLVLTDTSGLSCFCCALDFQRQKEIWAKWMRGLKLFSAS